MTTLFVNGKLAKMLPLEVIANPAAAIVALDPIRSRMLAELAQPASSATLALRLEIPRQKVNYHLTALEQQGLLQPAETRKWGGLTERILVASAASYLISPTALGAVAPDPAKTADRLSASYLIALAARVINEVKALLGKADETNKRLPTLSIDTEISFRSPEDRANFTRDFTLAVTKIAEHYHHPSAPGARAHRLIAVAHPLPTK